jgi:two-component system nitrogen regulation sensor histidine kinase NtrY
MPKLEAKLGELREGYGLDDVRVFDMHGDQAMESGKRVSLSEHGGEIRNLVGRALNGQQSSRVARRMPNDAIREILWASAPIRSADGKVVGAVLTESLIPHSVNFRAYSVLEAYNVYTQLQGEKAKLRFNFILILTLSTLLIVFAFSWFAMYLAKRITVPIQALAEGAAEVATGNLDYRVVCEAFDELENLVVSFNRMTSDLQENKARIEAAQEDLRQSNTQLDDRRRYIETILQAIATGVLSLDSGYRIRTLNRAAHQMLQVQGTVADLPLEEVVPGAACETLRMLLQKSAVLGPVVRNVELALPGKRLHVATTVTPLLDSSGQQRGWVVVLDDVTELLRMEKLSAWREVARRLAHEIKNPLTPIQLSAERLLRRYRQLLPSDESAPLPQESWDAAFASFGNLMEECVRTITQEANSLKNLVDEFTRFARLPEIRLEDADLHGIIEHVLSLYNGRIQDVRLIRSFGGDIPSLRLDPEQMKRVLINLLDNALEAMSDSSGIKVLKIRTFRNTPQRSVRMEISDTGRGFPREYQDSLFLPYFSTRKGGTGLGLAIVRQIISDHNGFVRAEPNTPLGTTIIIDLPLATP